MSILLEELENAKKVAQLTESHYNKLKEELSKTRLKIKELSQDIQLMFFLQGFKDNDYLNKDLYLTYLKAMAKRYSKTSNDKPLPDIYIEPDSQLIYTDPFEDNGIDIQLNLRPVLSNYYSILAALIEINERLEKEEKIYFHLLHEAEKNKLLVGTCNVAGLIFEGETDVEYYHIEEEAHAIKKGTYKYVLVHESKKLEELDYTTILSTSPLGKSLIGSRVGEKRHYLAPMGKITYLVKEIL